ncbi:DNA cytosine methyltransferase [Haemophilus influenzae]|uniref:DNA cytosine methyltransferase n=1 Tax=Haemophilus influenzae TaxID=727 RepID=UPI001FFCC5F2|nr:DNA cytosine methyltransferase [Haemophilus influenzae]
MHSSRTIAWRILDAQYFGLAQRRKRVFLVASARGRRRPERFLKPIYNPLNRPILFTKR